MLLFKEHKNSPGFIGNVSECSSTCFVFMRKVSFPCSDFCRNPEKELLNSFIFKWDLKPMYVVYVVYECWLVVWVAICFSRKVWKSWDLLQRIFKKIRLKQRWTPGRCSITKIKHRGSSKKSKRISRFIITKKHHAWCMCLFGICISFYFSMTTQYCLLGFSGE